MLEIKVYMKAKMVSSILQVDIKSTSMRRENLHSSSQESLCFTVDATNVTIELRDRLVGSWEEG